MDHPNRKNLRLKDHDYRQNYTYFVTICTDKKRNLLSEIVWIDINNSPKVILTDIGIEIEKTIDHINNHYTNAICKKYVIMPNHVHLIITVNSAENMSLPDIIRQFKSFTTKRYNDIYGTKNKVLWQRNYYEHIIRNDNDCLNIWQYINNNPAKWMEDEYYYEV